MDQLDVFIPTFGNRPAHLVGRESVIGDFSDSLKRAVGHPNRATLLIGQRGMGKTALLLEFADKAEEAGFLVVRVTANEFILDDIVGMIQENGKKHLKSKLKVKGASAGAFGFSFGITFNKGEGKGLSFLNKMIALCEELEKHNLGLVLLVDEVQARSTELRVLTTTYQHLVGEGKNVALAMAGLPHAISAVLNDEVLTFFNRAHKVYLEPLSLSAISVYYSKVFTGLGLSISPENLDRAVVATRGYPYLLQLVGYYILNFAAENKEISGEIVTNALISARRDLIDNIFMPVLRPLSKKDLQFIKAMAEDVDESATSDIKTRMKTSDVTMHTYRKRLIDAGVIASERRGYVSFVVPYLGEYLRGEI